MTYTSLLYMSSIRQYNLVEKLLPFRTHISQDNFYTSFYATVIGVFISINGFGVFRFINSVC